MHNTERRRFETLTRVRDFGTTYGHLLPAATAGPAFAAVDGSIRELEEHDVTGTSATVRARATRKVAARKALQERMALVAKAAGLLPGQDTEFRGHFAVPYRANDVGLLTSARQMLEHAAPLAAAFIEQGMAESFPDDLEALIAGFEAALRDRGMSRDEQVATRARIKASLARGMTAVHKLDVMVGTHLAPDSDARQVWARSKRVYRKPRNTVEAPPVTAEAAAAA